MQAPRLHLLLLVLGSTIVLPAAQPAPRPPLPEPSSSAFASSSDGWTDLLDKDDLSEWRREMYPARRPMGVTNPWSYDASTGILRCDGVGVHEMLLHRAPRGDGIFRAEFRYIGAPAKPNSGLFVRTLPDASAWYQAQLAPSGLGVLFGQSPAPDQPKPKRLSAGGRYPELLRPPGEWNEVEITCRGSELTLWINGHVTARTNACPTLSGHVGLEAEFNPIEFRNLRFKSLP